MFEGRIAKYVGGGMFPEEDMLKTVHTHAAVAAISPQEKNEKQNNFILG